MLSRVRPSKSVAAAKTRVYERRAFATTSRFAPSSQSLNTNHQIRADSLGLSASARPLEGKVAIVTGSTSGIGLSVASQLAGAGARVVINGFGPASDIQTLTQSLKSKYDTDVIYNGADMTKPAEIRDLVSTAAKAFGRVDILVNNAGIQHVSPVDTFPEEKWDAILAINLTAPFHAIKAALPYMKQNKFGRIINISSVHGLVGSTHKSAYVASKHGIVGLTKVVALENAGNGITCNNINPGWVLTPLVEKQIEAKAAQQKISYEQAVEQLLAEKQPSKQFVRADDLGKLAVFLSTPAGDQINGISIPVDGAWTSQ